MQHIRTSPTTKKLYIVVYRNIPIRSLSMKCPISLSAKLENWYLWHFT